MRAFLLLTLFLLIAPLHGQAQGELEVITADNAAQLEELFYFGNGRLMSAVAWSPDARWVAAAGSIGVWVYDTTNLTAPSFFLEGHTQPVMQLAFSPDGIFLVSSSYDGSIIVWEFAARAQHLTLETELQYPSSNWVHALEFRPDGVLATGHYETIHFWNVNTGEEVAEPLELCGEYVTDIAFNDDGTLMACTAASFADYEGGEVAVWDFAAESEIELEDADFFDGYSVQFSDDSTQLTSLIFSRERFSWTWNLEDGTLIDEEDEAALPIPLNEFSGAGIARVEYSPDGSQFAYIRSDAVNVGDTQTGEVVTTPAYFAERVNSIAMNADSTLLAIERGGLVRIFDVRTRQDTGVQYTAVAFHPINREHVLIEENDANLRIINFSTGQTVMAFAAQSPVLSAQFSADGTVLAAHTEPTICPERGKAVRARQDECTTPNFYVWDTATGTEIFTAHIEYNFVYALSSDGSQLISTDGLTTLLWDLASGESQPVPEVDNTLYQYINAMTFSPDDTLLAAGTGGGVLGGYLGASTLWEVGSEDAPEILDDGEDVEGQPSGAVYAVDFNADGTLLLDTSAQTLYRDNVVRVWDVASRELLVTLYGHHDQVLDALFSPDGRVIYSAGLDGTVRVWGVPAEPAS